MYNLSGRNARATGALRSTDPMRPGNARREIAARDTDYSPPRRPRARRTHGRGAVASHDKSHAESRFGAPRSRVFDARVLCADGLILLGLGIYNTRRCIEIGARLERG